MKRYADDRERKKLARLKARDEIQQELQEISKKEMEDVTPLRFRKGAWRGGHGQS